MTAELGVVAIGRNEGERLRGCLASLVGRGVGLVYVDSGSSDSSVELARSLGVEVVELDPAQPFSAARARNEGFERLKSLRPGLRYVMFVDGDCEVVDGWIDRARDELEAHPRWAVVCGRRREKFPRASVYNRLADLEWNSPVGEAVACGGDSVMRVEAFEAVGGFDPTAAAGEEPELCQRLRLAGWSVWRIDAEMTRHDIALTRFRQWWRREYRNGYNGLDILTRFHGPDRLFAQALRRARIWGIGWPLAVLTGTSVAAAIGGVRVGLIALPLLLLTLPLQMARLVWKARRRIDDPKTAMAYGLLWAAAHWANLAGQLGYLRDRNRGQMARLIEYKQAGATRPGSSSNPSPSSSPALEPTTAPDA
jgi:GT2 family glycosyltransferase